MKKIIVCLFIIASVFAIAKPSGTWRKLEPEGEVPGKRWQHYMCPIGEDEDGNSKVLMINGLGDGNPHAYRECWLFEYNKGIGKWNKLKLDINDIPDTYQATTSEDITLWQISKNKAMARGGREKVGDDWYSRYFLFDIDKMGWDCSAYYSFGEVMRLAVTQIKENLGFNYLTVAKYVENIFYGKSYLVHIQPDEPFYNIDNFFSYELVNDESITEQGPGYNNYTLCIGSGNEINFVVNNDYNNITFIYNFKGYNDKASFMDMSMQTYKWMFLEQEQDSLPEGSRRAYSNIANNLTLIYKDTNTYILE